MPADLIASHPAGEGIIRRAWRDTKQTAHSPWFIGADATAGAACAALAALILADPDATTFETVAVTFAGGVGGLLVVVFVIFLSSLLRAPFRQRDEARAEITPGFPRHTLRVGSPWYRDFEVEGSTDRLIFLDITFTNREPQQRLSLDFELETVAVYGEGQVLGPYKISEYSRRKIADTISSPLSVAPETTIKGHLLLDALGALLLDFEEDGMAVWPTDHARMILRITDQVSGGVVEQPVPVKPKSAEAQ